MMDLAAIGQALRNWIRTATGYPDARVIFADQDGPRPERPYAALKIGTVRTKGIDENRQSFDANQVGEEVGNTAIGIRELVVTANFFGAKTAGVNAAQVAMSAASRAQTAVGLTTVRGAFHAAGATAFAQGDVRNLSAVLDDDFEGRAQLELRLYAADDITERVGYAETFGLADNIDTEENMAKQISYDLLAGASRAELSNLMAARSYPGSPPILLGPGVFLIDETTNVPGHVRIRGAGMGVTILKPTSVPDVSLADVVTNALLLADAAITPTVNTALAIGIERGDVTTTLVDASLVVPGAMLEVRAETDEAGTSDGAGNVSVQRLKVISKAGNVITHFPAQKAAKAAGSTVKSFGDKTDLGLEDLTLDGSGSQYACGFVARRCADVMIRNVEVKGFTRVGLLFSDGTRNGHMFAIHNGGGNNAVAHLDSADECSIGHVTAADDGDRHNAVGIPRGHVMFWNDCNLPRFTDSQLARGCLAFWDRKSHGQVVQRIQFRDFVPDEAATRLAAANEYDAGASIGVFMSSSGKLSNSANSIGGLWVDIVGAECSSAMGAGIASLFFVHDHREFTARALRALHAGGAANPGTLFPFHARDSNGLVEDVSAVGYADSSFKISGFQAPLFRDLGRRYESGLAGQNGPSAFTLKLDADGPDVSVEIDGLSAGGFINIAGVSATVGIPNGLKIRNLRRWADDCSGGDGLVTPVVNAITAGAVNQRGVGQKQLVAVDRSASLIAGYAQFKEVAALTDALRIVMDGAHHLPMVNQYGGIMIWSPAGTLTIRDADGIQPEDIIQADLTDLWPTLATRGKFGMKNNAPAPGTFVFRALSRKAAGVPGSVLVSEGFYW